ncbi:putative bifunctional diguanylate cyclase/phosphodiesterase [Trinickia sp. EG282A]|uniref:putative bifunctional diguanylate cyclase/phosphodiesterase n=1 Tax=Trinickia sp. EG282A TaxID=3237013 RepID=UPI0034D25315
MYDGSYHGWLVLLSFAIAVLASYTALDMASNVSTAKGRSAWRWLAAGACAMGIGIWSMHFTGMLAFSLPIPLGYDPAITGASLLIAIASSAFALWWVSRPSLSWRSVIGGALVMGAGISSMHYTGMAAMRMMPGIQFDRSLTAASIGIAVLASGAALQLAFRLRARSSRVKLWRAGAAVVMGSAIIGMHYTGMAAAEFPVGAVCGAALDGFRTDGLALSVAIGTVAVLVLALTVSVFDLRLQTRASALAESEARAHELAHLATHDMLTGLPNRAAFEARLNESMADIDLHGNHVAVMFIDLDGFKAVNDALGHHAGDLLLIEVARRMRKTLRRGDMVARLGGDEFVMVVNIDRPADAAEIARGILGSLDHRFELQGLELHLSASVGIAVYPDDGKHPHELLRAADAAMYRAKSQGKNGYWFYDPSLEANARELLQLAQDLRWAVQRNELILYYQPKLDVSGDTIVGVEALLRWRHPTRGLILPERFIALAERVGLILPIGEWVIDEACRQISNWRSMGLTNWTMAVNLSAIQIRHSALPDIVCAALERHAVAPHCLVLEITESTMVDMDASIQVIERLHRMGVQIAIDDFGIGYSSLLNLKRLPVHELKIDRGFVRELESRTSDEAIVSAIVAMGKTLNLRIVAEGVETAEQHALLSGIGCHSMQGFLFAQPMPADRLVESIEQDGVRVRLKRSGVNASAV